MRKIGRKVLASVVAAACLMAATPAYAGYDVIYFSEEDGVTIVGYEKWCGGVVVEAYGIHPTAVFSWFYNNTCY